VRLRHGEFKAGELIAGTRYRVLGLLGAGGMGTVYEVEHTELGKRFVLKALLSDLSRREDLVARLRNEQRALGRLEHPSIVNVTDAGVTTTNVPYFVMERLDGETLGARIKRTGYLPIGEALEIAAAVLDGLAAAHEIGVVHRDVKPQNIFLAHGKYPKILDFGVAKVADTGGITARGVAVGTPRYMSPEQASGEKLDGRSDLYAVGLVLYEMMVGRGPFDDARDANEMLLAHLSHPPPRLSTRVGSVTRDLEEFLGTLLAKNPGARPPTARDAAAALRTLAAPYRRGTREAGGHAQTVRLGAGPEAPVTTHADGVAARKAWGLHEGTTEDAKTLARIERSRGPNDTLIDPPGARGARSASGGDPSTVPDATLRDYEGAAPTTRTEILSVVDGPNPGDVETHTRVPLTPTDGSRTLDPVPLSQLPLAVSTGARRKRVLAGFAVALVAGVASFVYAVAHNAAGPEVAVAPVAEKRVAAAPNAASQAMAEPVPVRAASPITASSGAEPASTSSPAPSPVSAAPSGAPPKKTKKTAKPSALAPRVPDGLPSSGL